MLVIYLLLYIAAAVCFALAGWSSRPEQPGRPLRSYAWLGWIGLLCWVLVPLFHTLTAMAD